MSGTEAIIEAAGWVAAVLILGSYVLVSTGRLEGRSPAFQWMNVIGSAGFVINSGWHHALPSTVVNVIWMAIGLVTLASLRKAVSRP